MASAEFSLADEVNLGTYHLRALMGDSSAPVNSAEVALNVERYVLPKFKVAVEFAEKDNKPRRDYRPGDHVTGTVRANYFFGKPVDHAETAIKVSSMDVDVFEAASIKGKTDKDGVYHFDLVLPGYFAGRNLSQGAARALVEATVKDSAGHSETRAEPITISQSALLITAIPESGTLIPHLENQVFLLSSYPDGTPATAALTVHIPAEHDQHITTDSSGIATVHISLAPAARPCGLMLMIIAVLAPQPIFHWRRAKATTRSCCVSTAPSSKPANESVLKVLSTRARGSAYIDIVRNGQTILTRDVELQNGAGRAHAHGHARRWPAPSTSTPISSAATPNRWLIIV